MKDTNYLKKFKYLSSKDYKEMWTKNNYGNYSPTHIKRIKNFWDTFAHYGFNKDLLN